MILGDEVVGAVTWLRGDLTKVFTAQEQEVAGLLAGKVGLALVERASSTSRPRTPRSRIR